jgi:hypothetical protein
LPELPEVVVEFLLLLVMIVKDPDAYSVNCLRQEKGLRDQRAARKTCPRPEPG